VQEFQRFFGLWKGTRLGVGIVIGEIEFINFIKRNVWQKLLIKFIERIRKFTFELLE